MNSETEELVDEENIDVDGVDCTSMPPPGEDNEFLRETHNFAQNNIINNIDYY